MAYVKIKPIHSNIEKALEYITNPDKTSNSTLVSSYGCSISPKVAKLEFELVNKKSLKKRNDSFISTHRIHSCSSYFFGFCCLECACGAKKYSCR